MLRRNPNSEPFPHDSFDAEPGENDLIDLDRIAGMIRRQWKLVLTITLIGAALGMTYLWFATPFYNASAEVLIDQGDAGLNAQVTGNTDTSQSDTTILSQVELITSPNVAGEAVDKLQLDKNAAFLASGKTLKSQLMGLLKPFVSVFQKKKPITASEQASVPQTTPRDIAIDIVQGATNVQRVRGTFLLQITYSNPDPVLATDIANAIAEGYLADQLNSKYDAARRASDWLQQRIAELSKESMAADVAVQNFRAQNNLETANGQLITDQQVAQLNTNLVSAQNATAAAKAKVDQINTILAANDPNALVTAALDSPLINSLRQHYLDSAKREADFANLVGDDHIQTQKLKQEMAEYQREIREELTRIAAGDQSDYQVAQAHEQAARDALTQATQGGAASDQTVAKLNGLESQAASLKSLYSLFLQNYQATSQQSSFPIANARIVAPATVPSSPSSPVAFLVIAAGTFLGGLIGVGAAGLREFSDRFVRTVEHLRGEIGLEYLGLVPLLHIKDKHRRNKGALLPNQVAPLKESMFRYAAEHRRSQFAESLRSAKVAADLALADEKSKVLGSISMLPDEGKTTLCYNLASLIATSGARTLVIDADLRRPTLSKTVAPHCKAGLVEVVLRQVSFEEAIFRDAEIGLDVLPIALSSAALSSADLLGSAAFAALLQEARRHYDYVILDLPPVAAVVDARAVSPQVDAFILVVQWGSTSRQFLQNTLAAEPRIAEKCVGAILNKADIKKLQLYRTPGSSESYMTEYSAYFQDSV